MSSTDVDATNDAEAVEVAGEEEDIPLGWDSNCSNSS